MVGSTERVDSDEDGEKDWYYKEEAYKRIKRTSRRHCVLL